MCLTQPLVLFPPTPASYQNAPLLPSEEVRAHSVRKETTLSSEFPQKSMTAEFKAWIPHSLGLEETRASMWIEGVGYTEPVPTHPVRWPVLLLPH